jgi:hypothetical protein
VREGLAATAPPLRGVRFAQPSSRGIYTGARGYYGTR